jgi:5-methylcytosine-specific restriction endonuclease McrA
MLMTKMVLVLRAKVFKTTPKATSASRTTCKKQRSFYCRQEGNAVGTRIIKRRLFNGARKKECFYCRKNLTFDAATIDHKKPRSDGGKTTMDNSVVSCKKCNNKKGSLSFEGFLRTLKWRALH